MSAQRRDADRTSADSMERIWQTYADQVGIPDGTPTGGDEPVPQQPSATTQTRRPSRVRARSAGGLLAATAVAVVTMIAGIALWSTFPRSRDTADNRPAPSTSIPVAKAASLEEPSAPGQRAGEGLQASSAIGELLPQQPAPPLRTMSDQRDTTQSANIGYRINFDFGSDSINEESKRILSQVVAAMKAHPEWRIVVEGHTDMHGALDYNRLLSERRAQAVKAHLQSGGIAPGRLSAVGFGASRPVAPEGSSGILNRRVDLRLL
jgi:outer membrane protein OmpA-like peptidoglycan-associated protein